MKRFQLLDSADFTDREYQDYILQGVSRTFALTIPQLPKQLETVVGNAYLWCRIADTIEDDPQLCLTSKEVLSGELTQLLQTSTSPESVTAWVAELLPQLHGETAAAELDLIANSQRVLRLFFGFSESQQTIIQRSVATMVQGMMHYQAHQPHAGLPDLQSLDNYCYHVAGIVGEMLTLLYCDYSSKVRQHQTTLMPLAVSFGQGLQMTNILKDIWQDQSRGICWLPQDVFGQFNIDLKDLPKQRTEAGFHLGVEQMVTIGHHHLQDAMGYTLMIPRSEQGYRNFCLWAIGMALLTLKNIHQQPDFERSTQIKISRNKVKIILIVTRVIGRSNMLVKVFFKRLARGLPV